MAKGKAYDKSNPAAEKLRIFYLWKITTAIMLILIIMYSWTAKDLVGLPTYKLVYTKETPDLAKTEAPILCTERSSVTSISYGNTFRKQCSELREMFDFQILSH